jgi:S1/P1 Nuclease
MSRSLPRGAAKGFSITADRQPMVVAAGVWSAIRILLKPFEYRQLSFLVHMPFHMGDHNDKGGNRIRVRFFDRGTNMHRLWDSDMIVHIGDTEDFWLLGRIIGVSSAFNEN